MNDLKYISLIFIGVVFLISCSINNVDISNNDDFKKYGCVELENDALLTKDISLCKQFWFIPYHYRKEYKWELNLSVGINSINSAISERERNIDLIESTGTNCKKKGIFEALNPPKDQNVDAYVRDAIHLKKGERLIIDSVSVSEVMLKGPLVIINGKFFSNTGTWVEFSMQRHVPRDGLNDTELMNNFISDHFTSTDVTPGSSCHE